jgi:hypothetical protein
MFKGKKKHVLSCGLCFPVDGYRATCGSPRKHQLCCPFFSTFQISSFQIFKLFFPLFKIQSWMMTNLELLSNKLVECTVQDFWISKRLVNSIGFSIFLRSLEFQSQIFSWHSGKILCPLLCIPWYPKNRLLLQQLIREVPPDLWSSNITEHRVVREEEIIHIELRVKFIFFRLQLFLHQTHRMIVLWLLETEGLLLQANTSRRGLTCFDARN